MTTLQRTLAWVIITALTAFGAAFAQQDDQANQEQQQEQAAQQQPTETRTVQIRGEEVAPLGEIEVGQARSYEESETQSVEVQVQTGAISFNVSTPGDQSPNIDVVGPNGYYQRVEVNAGDDQSNIIGGLIPGVYSIAATDDNLQVAHTLVEVTPGQIIDVQFSLQELAAFEEGAFQPDTQTAFPDNAYEAQEPVAMEDVEFGEVTVETQDDNTRFVVTGPDNYSQEFSGSFTASELAPGVYVIAGTREGDFQAEALTGTQIATSAVEVNVSQAVTFVPVYDIVGAETVEAEGEVEEVEDVAGGGAAQEDQQQQEEQQQEEQQQEEQQQEQQQETEGEAGEGPIEEPVEEAVDPDAEQNSESEMNQDGEAQDEEQQQ